MLNTIYVYMHIKDRAGAIKDHFQQTHDMTLTRNSIVDCTKIARRESDVSRLQIAEPVIILSGDPLTNRQDTGKTSILKSFS